MIAVHHNDRACLPSGSRIDETAPVTRILNQTANRSRVRIDNRNDAIPGYQIIKAYLQKKCILHQNEQPSFSLSLQILDLLADLFDLAFHFNNPMGQVKIIGLGSNCVYFTIHFLDDEVQFFANGFI